MMHGDTRPGVLEIRAPQFSLDPARIHDWHGGDVVRSALFNALSLFLPGGESFFVRAITEAQADREASLDGGDAMGFCRQEMTHRRAHLAYNDLIVRRRRSARAVLWLLDLDLAIIGRLTGPLGKLAVTVALEHLTAVLARLVLGRPEVLEGADPEYASLWRWHAMEELEHHRVTFDLYRELQGGERRRIAAMTAIWTILALEYVAIVAYLLIRERGLSAGLALFRKLGRTDAFAATMSELRSYLRRDFDPSRPGDAELAAAWRRDPGLQRHWRRRAPHGLPGRQARA